MCRVCDLADDRMYSSFGEKDRIMLYEHWLAEDVEDSAKSGLALKGRRIQTCQDFASHDFTLLDVTSVNLRSLLAQLHLVTACALIAGNESRLWDSRWLDQQVYEY